MIIPVLTGCLIALGILGTILPVIPGTVIAFAGIFLHKLALGSASVSWEMVAMAFGITILTVLLDVWCSWWGARRFGATWKGAMGAVLGSIAGFLLFSIPGLLAGPIVGAILFELLDQRPYSEAARAGLGTIIGAILAFFLKLGLTVFMVVSFYASLPGLI